MAFINFGIPTSLNLPGFLSVVGLTTTTDLRFTNSLVGASAAANGFKLFDTADEVTNTSFLQTYYDGSTYRIHNNTTGAGAGKGLAVGYKTNAIAGSTSSIFFRPAASVAGGMTFDTYNSSVAGTIGYQFRNGGNSASSGAAVAIALDFTYNQTGTAGSTDFRVNRTNTALGSGLHSFLDFQNSAVSAFRVAQTGDVLIGSTSANGIQLFGTVDQVTNVQSLSISQSTTLGLIATVIKGTGTATPLSLRSFSGVSAIAASAFTINRTAMPFFLFDIQTGTTGLNGSLIQANGTFVHTAGAFNLLNINPTLQHSGTAGYTGLMINIVETSLGSGVKNLIVAQAGTTGGTNMFVVSNLGVLTLAGSITTGAPSSGTANAWKLGSAVITTGLVLSTTTYVQIDIAGTAYKLATIT